MSKSKEKHLTLNDRILILNLVSKGYSLRTISSAINCCPTTVSNELHYRRELKQANAWNGAPLSKCNSGRTEKAPWICNGCENYTHCRKQKYIYNPENAHHQYRVSLIATRSGTHCNPEALKYLDKIITPAIKEKSQTLDHLYSYMSNELGISRSTLYRYVGKGYLEIKNIDLPKRVKYKANRVKKVEVKERVIRKGRTYLDFLAYIDQHHNANIYELDSVIGKSGSNEKVLLTILLRKSNFMMAFIRDRNDSKSVVDIFNRMEAVLGRPRFATLFYVGLTDNGQEFSRINELECPDRSYKRTHLFYCDSRQDQQKGKIEKNHEYIRKYLPQGTSFNDLTQKDIDIMMNHINSVKRASLEGRSPFECLSTSQAISIKKLGYKELDPNKVVLNPSLFKKKH